MLNRIDSTLIYLVLLLGVAHTSLTPTFYETFSLESVWFAGSGLAFVFLGLLHLARRKSKSSQAILVSCLASAVASVFSVLIVLKLTEPQAYVSVVANGLLCITSAMMYRQVCRRG